MMRRFLFRLLLSVMLLFTVSNGTFAQCALCKSTAESSLKEGSTQAKGLNTGILYLLVMPYLLVGGIGYWWYTQRKKQSEAGSEV
ncbi:MAG: hypothetical protein K1X63_10875 [Chitinophagales bacterium]|nr:hypothetical protein [Chitinophagales bacterium]